MTPEHEQLMQELSPMHSVETESGTVFNFNSDLSGMIRISRDDGKTWLEVPGEDLLRLVLPVVIDTIRKMGGKEMIE